MGEFGAEGGAWKAWKEKGREEEVRKERGEVEEWGSWGWFIMLLSPHPCRFAASLISGVLSYKTLLDR